MDSMCCGKIRFSIDWAGVEPGTLQVDAKYSFAVRGNQIREEKEVSRLFGISGFVIAQLVFVE